MRFCRLILLCLLGLPLSRVEAQESTIKPLSIAELDEVDQAIARAIDWLASNTQPDGSFATLPDGQPGITSLCVLAMLAGGELPGEGPHGEKLAVAIDYVRIKRSASSFG